MKLVAPISQADLLLIYLSHYGVIQFYNSTNETNFTSSVVTVDNVRCGCLSRNSGEAKLGMEEYKTMRDRAPYPSDQMVHGLIGHFAIVLFHTKTSTLSATRVIPTWAGRV